MKVSDSKPESYNQILKSTSLIGGAAGVNLLLGMVRMKFAAVLIGPIGVGLVGTYQAIQGMVGTVAGLGIQQSAVRDIAAAVGQDDKEAVGRIILSLRRVCWLTGIVGMILMVALAIPLSQYTFDTAEYALDIALLGPIVFFTNIQGGQAALLQGMRRIGDLARLNLIGAIAGTVVTVALYSWIGVRGIIPSLVLLALIQLIATQHFSRRIVVLRVQMSWKQSFDTANSMLRLGLVFMWNGVMLALVAYLTRAWISQEVSLAAVGIFTAAFALSGMFINFVLSAMGSDYYPRLTAVANDHAAMTKLVNEQTEIGLLLAFPGLLATLGFAPWIIQGFYTAEFLSAVNLLQWLILGCLGRVIAFPLGYIMLAQEKSKWFFFTETTFNVLHGALIWIALVRLGLEGVAIAFFITYLLYTAAVYCLARHLIGFTWSPAVRNILYLILPAIMIALASSRFLPVISSTLLNGGLTVVASMICLREIAKRVGHENKCVKLALHMPGMQWMLRM